uniref:Hybrid nrps pks n=2 Tax=Colletotrichum fructicola (strain Nara gc5) TaxID=1213859 RepID=L2GC77_COLFN
MWSSAADGYSRGEGVACVILKTVPQALHDGDRIYAVVRETGVNQDGRTTGITMPSSTAQTDLIRETYAKAGLDLRKAEDRCQFFEAHGTGTPAGDPIEAQAIWDAFFTPPTNQSAPPEQLYVGSVKTVVGHLEGCAGLAGVIKACLGLHQGFIPSNLHLGTPNPKIAPMLGPGKLLVPTEHLPWPEPVKSTDPAIQIPRRASVNSFGFGGTNAHAILESFDAIASKGTVHKAPKTPKQPPVNIVISAAKEPSLASLVSRYADYLEAHPDVNLDSLAWTTQKRRTRLEYGISFTGSSRSILVKQMRTSVKAYHDGSHIGVSSTTWNSGSEGPEILGVFTGQGAQWATMGAKLLDACPAFAQSIARLENALLDTMAVEEELSGSSKWSLSTELRAPIGESRIAEAEFAQPLSTAVQVALVDTLRSVGVNFSAVIGHSSGELAAAYTVGCISAADAIRMAYYRGRFSKLARSPHDTDGDQGGKGGMLAAGISWDDAQILCSDSQLGFRDHVCVAANNAPRSVTLSGDLHKLREMQTLLRDRNVPVQMLRVDKAYHSPHMRVSGDAYREALSRCRLDGPQPTSNRPTCVWISSVHMDWEPISNANLHNLPQSLNSAQYWVENMLAPVRFRDALERLAKLKKVRAGLEVGPHPALRRQVVDTLTVFNGELAYRGTLARGVDERDSLSSVYGFLWERGINIDFDATSVSSNKSQVPLAGLPTMAWLHDRVYWRESARLSQLLRREPSSPLIGHCIDQGLRYDSSYTGAVRKSAESVRLGEWRWRQIIRVSEIPWLRGHKVQGQIVFPAAGYCVMAMDATSDLIKILCQESSTQTSSDLELDVIELQDVEFGRAVMLSEKNTEGIDILIRLHDIVLDGIKDASQTKTTVLKHSSTIHASFSIQAQLPAVGEPARLNEPYVACHGHLVANLRLPSSSVFTSGMPPYHDDPVHLHTISTTSIYDSYKVVGLEYTAPFQVDSLRRCLGRAKSTVRHANVTLTKARPHDQNIGEAMGEHTQKTKEASSCFPVAALDNAFQTSLAAFASPGDGRLLAPYLPRTIGRLRVQLSAYRAFMDTESGFLFDATIKGRSIREELRRVSEGNTLASWTATVEGLAFDPPPGVNPRPGNNQHQYRMIFQVEDLRCVNLVPSHGSYQEGIFCEEIWAPDPDDALRDFQLESDTLGDLEGLETVEELAHYYMCNVYESFTMAEAFDETRTPWFIRRFWEWLHHRLEGPGGGPHSNYVNPWASDPARRSSLMRRVDRIKHRVEVQILEAVAANILRVMRQEDGQTILEVLFRNDMLARLYVEPAMYARANRYLGRVASLIAHRFPRCDILEVGAGTGGATQAMFTGLGGAYGSYTFTDISSGFFPQAKIKFAAEVRRMIFKTLDIETDVVDQALTPATYDIIVASNVLHATRDIEASLKNVRKLLKPGGFLLLLEVTSVDKVLVPYLMGAVPGWWYFEDRWRKDTFSPLLTTGKWHEVLQASGFQTGTEHIFRDMEHPEDHLSSVMLARATDEDWMAFRECVPTSTTEFSANSLVIVKGKEENAISHGMALELKTRILGVCGDRVTVTIVDGLQTAAASSLLPSSMVIVLSDIESPLLGSPTSADWEALKIVFSGTSHDIFWVTSGRVHGRDPNQNMIVGLGRCARYENPGLRLRFIDVDDCTSSDAIQLISRIVWQAGFLSSKDASDLKAPKRVAVSDATIYLLAKDPQILDWSLAGGDESPTGQLSSALLPNPACLFSPKKTYLFAGITSDLGLSVAKWMIQNGARSVALASRAPNIPKVWLEEMESLGATDVRSFSMDVTDAHSVKDVCDRIRDSMYPVAGVVFGAMVLNDTLLENMSFQTLQATMAPKVRGTYLVEQYYHETDLDFFIFMSSMSAIVGIRGQSNYCAGNMYGRAVVAGRRARGLAASTVDLSTVFGVGYFANAGASSLQTVHANLRGFNTLAIGEGDVLDAFHEAILRGPPNASATGDVIVGLGSETAVAIDQPPVSAAWHKDPRFGHFTARAGQKFDDRAAGGSAGGTSDMAKNVREKLSKTTTDEERLATLSSCFSAQIQDTMQLSSSSLRADVPLMDLGIDSLVAVDLRAWFFKELEVTVPVLSILNGESVRDLCKVVLSQV